MRKSGQDGAAMRPATIRSSAVGAALGLSGLLLATGAAAYELTLNNGYMRLLGEAYGYCAGQSFSAERVMREYPDLEPSMRRALLLFKAGTSNACGNTEDVLRQAMGSRFEEEMQGGMMGEMKAALAAQPLSDEIARLVIAEVEGRADWEIASPVREALLSIRYRETPAMEMADGFFQSFSTLGHPKARGVEATMKAPLSWKGAEGERPHIVQKWTSQAGFGRSTLMLDIRDGEGFSPSMAEVEAFAAMDDPLDMADEGSVFRGASAFRHEAHPAIRYKYDMPLERAGVAMITRAATHQIFLGDHVVGVMCQTVGTPDQMDAIAAEFEAMAPLCRMALNSLVLLDAYR